MTGFEDVRGAPGGGELADLAAQLAGNPGAISGAAATWRTSAGTGQQHTSAIQTAAGDVDAAWQGASADAFHAYMGKVVRCGGALHQALSSCADQLAAAGEALKTAEDRALEICQGYGSAVREQRTKYPQATEAEITQSVQPALGEARTALRQLITNTDATLSGAAKNIQATLGGLPDFGAELSEPDSQPFAPGPGRALDWSPATQADHTSNLARASGQGGGSGGFGGYGASGAPPSGPPPEGEVADWIAQAIEVLKANGVPADKLNPNDIWTIIKHESGGNPYAINNWDSNAAAGTPSKGLMQTIDPTFSAYKLPGHENIYNPVDNIIAGVRYAISRYGSVSAVPGLVGMRSGSGYQGY